MLVLPRWGAQASLRSWRTEERTFGYDWSSVDPVNEVWNWPESSAHGVRDRSDVNYSMLSGQDKRAYRCLC